MKRNEKDTQEIFKKRVLQVHEERGDFVTDFDGFVKFWPKGMVGYLESYHLRWIADELDKRNQEWTSTINKYFDEQKADRTDVDFNF